MITVGLVLLLLAALIGWSAGPGLPTGGPGPATAQRAAWLIAAAGSAVLAVAGAAALTGYRERLVWGRIPGAGAIGLTLDPLSGLFLLITFGTATLVMIAGPARPRLDGDVRRRLPAAAAIVALAAAVVILASDLFALLAGWEALGFAFYLAVGFDRRREGRGRAALLAAGFSTVSGGMLLAGGGLLAAQAGSISLANWGVHPGATTAAGYALLIAGFGIKVGLVPAHVWLPPRIPPPPGQCGLCWPDRP